MAEEDEGCPSIKLILEAEPGPWDCPERVFMWQTVGNEVKDLKTSFPLQRRLCGYWPPGKDHSGHDPQRLMYMYDRACRCCAAIGESIAEESDMSFNYTIFTAYCEDGDKPASRQPSDVADFLARRLCLLPEKASAKALPIDEDHRDLMLCIHAGDMFPSDEHTKLSKHMNETLTDHFYFKGSTGSGEELINTYPVVYAGFTEDGDIAGLLGIRCDT